MAWIAYISAGCNYDNSVQDKTLAQGTVIWMLDAPIPKQAA